MTKTRSLYLSSQRDGRGLGQGALHLVRRGWTGHSSIMNRANGRPDGLNVKCERRKVTRMPLVLLAYFSE